MTSFLRRRPTPVDEPTQPMPTYKLLPQADYDEARLLLRAAAREAQQARHLPRLTPAADEAFAALVDRMLDAANAMERSLR